MSMHKVAIILPSFNEGKTIGKVLRSLTKWKEHIIVVDDGSTDDTYHRVSQENVTVLRHIVNLGKGTALKTGIDYALEHGFTDIILMDADGQHDPSDLTAFFKTLKKYDLVLGFRKSDFNKAGLRFLGNMLESWILKILYGKSIRDPLCGFRGFKSKIYSKIAWESSGYEVETEMVIRAIKNKINFAEIPVSVIYLDKYKGVSILEGYKFIVNMVKWRLTI